MNKTIGLKADLQNNKDNEAINKIKEIIELNNEPEEKIDHEMISVLENLLANDQDITASAVARLHPSIKATSSITRSRSRLKLLDQYKTRQDEMRTWQKRISKESHKKFALKMAEKDSEITKLKCQISLLTASHVAMIRAIGELGGFEKWAQFFDQYKSIRDELSALAALPKDVSE